MRSGWESELPRMASVKNSVRVEVTKEAEKAVKERFGVEWICEKIVRELCGYDLSQIFCLQDFARAGFADVSLMSPKACQGFYAKLVENKEHESLRGLKVFPLFGGERVPLTVHMYNPYVREEEIVVFLRRFCEEVSGGEKLLNKYGIWTGRRRYTIRFRTNAGVPGGVEYPPGTFAIGPNRGFLWFPGQPVQCWKCGATGHMKEQCVSIRCRNCDQEGHVAAKCAEAKSCGLCGSLDHLYRQCPKRESSYAGRASGAGGEEGQQEERTVTEVEEAGCSAERKANAAGGMRKRFPSWAEVVEGEGKRRGGGKHMAEMEAAMMDQRGGEEEEEVEEAGEAEKPSGGEEGNSTEEKEEAGPREENSLGGSGEKDTGEGRTLEDELGRFELLAMDGEERPFEWCGYPLERRLEGLRRAMTRGKGGAAGVYIKDGYGRSFKVIEKGREMEDVKVM